jgi:hypothetical protein
MFPSMGFAAIVRRTDEYYHPSKGMAPSQGMGRHGQSQKLKLPLADDWLKELGWR